MRTNGVPDVSHVLTDDLHVLAPGDGVEEGRLGRDLASVLAGAVHGQATKVHLGLVGEVSLNDRGWIRFCLHTLYRHCMRV